MNHNIQLPTITVDQPVQMWKLGPPANGRRGYTQQIAAGSATRVVLRARGVDRTPSMLAWRGAQPAAV